MTNCSSVIHPIQLCSSSVDVTNVFHLQRSKVSRLFMRTQNRQNIDYQRAIRQHGSVQSSLLWNTNRLDWETRQRFETRGTGEQDKNIEDYMCRWPRRKQKVPNKTGSSSGRHLWEPTSVLTLKRWTSLRHMPMTGGRGEIWYLITIYCYWPSLVNNCSCYLLRPFPHGNDKIV